MIAPSPIERYLRGKREAGRSANDILDDLPQDLATLAVEPDACGGCRRPLPKSSARFRAPKVP